jgi:hypothetical protein
MPDDATRQDVPSVAIADGNATGDRRAIGVAGGRREQTGATGRAPGPPGADVNGRQRPGVADEQRRRFGGGGAGLCLRPAAHPGSRSLAILQGGLILRDVEEQIVLGRQVGERRRERLVHLLEELPTGPLGLGLFSRGDGCRDIDRNRGGDGHECVEGRIGHDA